MELFKSFTGKGTYATRERAVKKIEDVCEKCGMEFRYLILATTDGRFAPVVILTRDQHHFAGSLAYAGICVTF